MPDFLRRIYGFFLSTIAPWRTIDEAAARHQRGARRRELASVDSLRRLETLRQSLETLTEYNREGAPLGYRWGLYVGNDLYPDVRRLYFATLPTVAVRPDPEQPGDFSAHFPPRRRRQPHYDQTYEKLKAYLITTSNHDKAPAVPSPVC